MNWEQIKVRSAGDGYVYATPQRELYLRTGSLALKDEVSFQLKLADADYPVPEVIEHGETSEGYYFIERSIGSNSLHDLATKDFQASGEVREETLDKIIETSSSLFRAQLRTMKPNQDIDTTLNWFSFASYIDNVVEENPDLANSETSMAINSALKILQDVPFALSHLDYGLPNSFERGVIDWQHGTVGPVGYDVYPMLEIIPFKGGNRGYSFSPTQREKYIHALDELSQINLGKDLSDYLPQFLLVKSLFFLALMKPNDMTNEDKILKWNYRRHLASLSMSSYLEEQNIDTSKFPTLAEFRTLEI